MCEVGILLDRTPRKNCPTPRSRLALTGRVQDSRRWTPSSVGSWASSGAASSPSYEELKSNVASLTLARGLDKASLSRSAYDAARAIGLPQGVSDRLATAWVAAERYVSSAALLVEDKMLTDLTERTTFVRRQFMDADDALRESGFEKELREVADS